MPLLLKEKEFPLKTDYKLLPTLQKKPSSVACNTDNKIYVQGAAYA